MQHTFGSKLTERKQRQKKQQPRLNLVSLMDIFTILVFFLLINSADVEILQTDKTIKLPDSTSTQKPEVTTIVRVNNETLFVGERLIARLSDIADSDQRIEPLFAELSHQASRAAPLAEGERERGRAITILGDQELPYQLLKRIMNTCAEADFRNISFAVNQKAAEAPAAAGG